MDKSKKALYGNEPKKKDGTHKSVKRVLTETRDQLLKEQRATGSKAKAQETQAEIDKNADLAKRFIRKEEPK